MIPGYLGLRKPPGFASLAAVTARSRTAGRRSDGSADGKSTTHTAVLRILRPPTPSIHPQQQWPKRCLDGTDWIERPAKLSRDRLVAGNPPLSFFALSHYRLWLSYPAPRASAPCMPCFWLPLAKKDEGHVASGGCVKDPYRRCGVRLPSYGRLNASADDTTLNSLPPTPSSLSPFHWQSLLPIWMGSCFVPGGKLIAVGQDGAADRCSEAIRLHSPLLTLSAVRGSLAPRRQPLRYGRVMVVGVGFHVRETEPEERRAGRGCVVSPRRCAMREPIHLADLRHCPISMGRVCRLVATEDGRRMISARRSKPPWTS
ncbi:hypothetical protein HMN09_00662000 [Mycena chlorophos]|uniref:Uncharacterized protein n=1 Tax=Mycena chlorophos TaxID=658473 RepID=A0A8H6W701_MYCCL|nr:hypothetical protein HMN09_00662000 [Mycena chlorophos]